MAVLDVNLLECLNVLADKRDRHDHQVLNPLLSKGLDHVIGVRLQPLDRPHFALVRQMRRHISRVLPFDRVDGLDDVVLVGIAVLDVTLWHPMCTEEHVYALPSLVRGERVDLSLNEVGDGLGVSGSVVPLRHDRVGHVDEHPGVLLQDIDGAAAGRHTEVGVKRQYHHTIDIVAEHFGDCRPCVWGAVPHGDVRLCVVTHPTQLTRQRLTLCLCVSQYGRSAADRPIRLARLGTSGL
mmetsp:Transcript_11243/g.27210  ORF Transcript_11243/g.27210 Transcript_11243/m.27210 type:complete len:238 (+) Transcript_11243:537-1250(+)